VVVVEEVVVVEVEVVVVVEVEVVAPGIAKYAMSAATTIITTTTPIIKLLETAFKAFLDIIAPSIR
jgi:hypothetical protein